MGNQLNRLRHRTHAPPAPAPADQTPKVLVAGMQGSGKTALVIQFAHKLFVDEYDPTMEDSYRIVRDIRGEQRILDIMDQAGCDGPDDPWHKHMVGRSYGVAIVFSLTDRSSLVEEHSRGGARFWLNFIRSHSRREPGTYPLVLVGNKSDLEEERQVSAEEAEAVAEEFGAWYMETSAKTAEGVEGLDMLGLGIGPKAAQT